MSCIQGNECYPGNDMKRIIKKAVWKHEFESWVASQFMYPELDCYYKGVKNISMHCWWRYAAKNPRMTTPVSSVISVMMGSQPKSLQCNFYVMDNWGIMLREWDDIYRNIARFVHRMYLTRYQLYNSISSNNIWDLLNLCFLQMSCASVYIHELY